MSISNLEPKYVSGYLLAKNYPFSHECFVCEYRSETAETKYFRNHNAILFLEEMYAEDIHLCKSCDRTSFDT